MQAKAKAETVRRAKMSSRQEQGKAKTETIGGAKMSSRQEQGKARTANISGKRDHGKAIKTRAPGAARDAMGARITVTTESTGGDARAITANDVSRPSLSRSFKSPDVRHRFFYHAAMTATAQASASLCTSCSW